MAEGVLHSGTRKHRLAEGDDLEEQVNECIALNAIYENEDLEICDHDNEKGDIPGGIFNIPMYPPQPFFVKMTKDMVGIRRLAFAAAWGRGRSKRKSQDSQSNPGSPHSCSPPAPNTTTATTTTTPETDTTSSSSLTAKQHSLYPIKRLPPITLTFSFPHNYPSKNPPYFTLSCCWLEKKNLSKLCAKLDEIWTQCEGTAVIMNWVTFIQEEALGFLGIESPYDLGRVLVHVFTHPVKDSTQRDTHMPKLTPRAFDPRIFQTFGSIEEVLPTVLDSNLMTCEVCFEEKSGDKFMRLVNCVDHPQCKECVRGWFEEQIKEGAVRDLHCPGYKCEKMVLPTEVAHVVSPEFYQRYEKLLLKTAFDVMSDMVHCPRSFCQFPVLLEDNLGVCQQCHHAFCGRCQNTYHGHTPCKLKSELYEALYDEYQTATADRRRELEVHYGRQNIERMINEVKSNQWLENNSKQCPSCSTFIQKTDGCNRMRCCECGANFCWLCGTFISKQNPYGHFSNPGVCNGRLFEGVDLHLMFPEFLEEDEVLDNNEEDHARLVEEGAFDDAAENEL